MALTSILTWCAVYVGPGSSPPDPSWIGRPAFPRFRGTRVANTAHVLSASDGERDADRACFLARIAGLAKQSPIYLELETATSIEYVDMWINVIDMLGYRPGICCTYEALGDFHDLGIDPTEWLFRATSVTGVGDAARDGDAWWVH